MPPQRAPEDACPGVLRLTEAADGFLARVRLPGGYLSAAGLGALASAAEELGDGRLELTSRGNVQLRGLAADAGAELGGRLRGAGLWPSETHERIRNIVASPLAGLDREPDLAPVVTALDAALCATSRLAELSGRFLFAVDDGRGDVTGLGADVVVLPGPVDDVVPAAIAMAEAFLDERAAQQSTAWRVADLVDGRARIRQRLGVTAAPAVTPTAGPPLAGLLTQLDGGHALVLAVPLGRLGNTEARWLASQIGARPARVTPWRSVVLPDTSAIEEAAALGFGVTPDSPWLNVTACAGRPGCAKALADVQTDARAALERWPGRAVHWSGCERRCGRPTRTAIDVIATTSGYRIEGADA